MNRQQSTSIAGKHYPENPMGEGADRARRANVLQARTTVLYDQ